jgi:hypothetical protein
MLDAKNNFALRSYMNFKQYRDTVDMLEKNNPDVSQKSEKKGIMSFTKNVNRQKQKVVENSQDKELRTVLHYVKMIEGMNNGS